MLPDLIYWPFTTPAGIRLEMIYGEETCSPDLWLRLAYQIYMDNRHEEAREIGHFANGAPFLHGGESRISISHTPGLLVVASLPRTPEATLSEFSQRTALGVDCEMRTRAQAMKCIDRFAAAGEKVIIDPSDPEQCVALWTAKEALYKAALREGADFREHLRVARMPVAHDINPESAPAQFKSDMYGEAVISRQEGDYSMALYQISLPGHIVTLAYSPKCAKYKH